MSFKKPIDQLQSVCFISFDASASDGAAFLHSSNLSTSQVERDLIALEEAGPSDWSRDSKDLFLQTWTESESNQSMTWKEVETIEAGFRAFSNRHTGNSVIWFADLVLGVAVTKKGSMKAVLNPLAEKINCICEEKNIELQVKWLRQNKNTVADTLSRFVDLWTGLRMSGMPSSGGSTVGMPVPD